MALRLTVFLSLAHLSSAYTIYETNCSSPTTSNSYVTSPQTRGTLDILWSCLFTVIACTWTIQHLNVPEQRKGQDHGIISNIKWELKHIFTSTKWMLATVLAPEMLLAKNTGDLSDVKRDIKELQELAAQDDVTWTTTHSLFANMGGFVVRSHTSKNFVDQSEFGTSPDNRLKECPSRSTIATQSTASTTINLPPPNPFHLTAPDILALRKAGLLSRLPHITKEEIDDKSKSDCFVRIIALVQIVWMAIQVISRACRHQAISQLEISVCAFAVCAIFLYILNWQKPKGVQVAFTILEYPDEMPRPVYRIARKSQMKHEEELTTVVDTVVFMFVVMMGGTLPSNSAGSCRRNHQNIYKTSGEQCACIIGSMIFGAIHIMAWGFSFPSPLERLVWRLASIYTAAALLIFFVLLSCARPTLTEEGEQVTLLGDSAGFILGSMFFLYILARLFLIVETFRTLYFLPPSAYEASWVVNLPHLT